MADDDVLHDTNRVYSYGRFDVYTGTLRNMKNHHTDGYIIVNRDTGIREAETSSMLAAMSVVHTFEADINRILESASAETVMREMFENEAADEEKTSLSDEELDALLSDEEEEPDPA